MDHRYSSNPSRQASGIGSWLSLFLESLDRNFFRQIQLPISFDNHLFRRQHEDASAHPQPAQLRMLMKPHLDRGKSITLGVTLLQFTLHPSCELPSEARVLELEAVLKCKLPTSYREFLKKYNAPRLSPLEGINVDRDASIAIFAKPSDAYEPEWWHVRFTALSSPENDWGLQEQYEYMAEDETHLPELMAFGDNGGGVNFHLCLRGECAGGIYMAGDRYTKCLDEGRIPKLEDYVQICKDFDTFLESLRWVKYDRAGNAIVEPLG